MSLLCPRILIFKRMRNSRHLLGNLGVGFYRLALIGLAVYPQISSAAPQSEAGGLAEETNTFQAADASTAPVIPPKPRLQVDLSVGSPDLAWWRESMEGRDERIEWWQEAGFGCFIHWNASSLLGGEWQGEVYMGYAEHIQRMAKITQREYMDAVISKFDPVEFDAEEWVRVIKDAGMRYVVFTAKHHDGFAMWDSEVSDYNIVDATPFGRDPLAELKAACDKYGLKFGVYYSHAFDWGEEIGIGNDWEFGNPGGNLGLYGGLHWFDQNPELVEKYRPYIDKKSIPQVLELIEKYDPDLIWFDTASKYPLEETLRVLKAVREADPDIIVNSRVTFQGTVDFRDNHFGDYKSTGDRAVIYRAVDEPWESYPTTNESYGYHAHDHSHKTPDYLIKVLARAAAKGGNVMLNMGPMGNGQIDPTDVAIFAGIGEWMEVNEASIIDAGATTLKVHAWGESSLDGNRFYLHVFEWPEDGRIEIGGLKTDITRAHMLADPSEAPLNHTRLDNQTVQLELGGSEPELGHAVVVMDVEDARNVGEHRLLATDTANELHSFDAQHLGTGFDFGDGKARRDYVAGWDGDDQKVAWEVYLRQDAVFDLSVEFERIGEPHEFVVRSGEQTLRSRTRGPENDEWFSDYVINDLGQLRLEAGFHTLEFSVPGDPDYGVLRLRALHLEPSTSETGSLLYQDDFNEDLSQWVVEQEPNGTTTIIDGKMDIFSPKGSTIWFKHRLEGPIRIEYTATMVDEGGPHDRVSDLNCFWMAIDPDNPEDLFFDEHERTGSFGTYHPLRLYYVGYGANNNTTTRFRRYPGDGSRPMLPEHDLTDERFMHTPNQPIRIEIISDGNRIQFLRDGEIVYDIHDPEPYTEGWFGFRTVRNHMRIDDFRVYQLDSD